MPRKKLILIIGSINMDLSVRVESFPRPGETVTGSAIRRAPGGKGANQAVAAARSGAHVAFLGAVGADTHGRDLLQVLEEEGIDTSLVETRKNASSGTALITIDARGENQIVVSPGANAAVTPLRVRRARRALREAGLILLQREVPPETVEAAIQAAAAAGVPVLLNPAPAGKIPRRLLRKVHILIANQGEAEFLLGGSVRGASGALRGVSRLGSLLARGGIAIMTLGRRGACLHAPQSSAAIHVPAHHVRTVDTTGAGDAFVGAFAATWLESQDPIRAARFAAAAAALSVMRPGAIPSLPRIHEVHALLRKDGGRTT